MPSLNEHGRRTVETLAQRHGVSPGAAETLLQAIVAGGGAQAQFNHPELGGLGQWSSGGMLMIGDMFNHGLKARVAALAADLAGCVHDGALFAPASAKTGDGGFVASGAARGGWPAELGDPASAGSQNDMRYAVFPSTRRLAIERDGQVTVYDTADHRIGGVSQQQSGDQSLAFTSQHGPVRLADLKIVAAPGGRPASPAHPAASPAPEAQSDASHQDGDIFTKIERLHELRLRGVITAPEFEAKKAELLARL